MSAALRPRWWQWPTVLSLDAPIVAVLWQALLAHTIDATLGWPPMVVLGLSVWLAYAADRWLEGWRLEPESIRTPRHYFYRKHRWPVTVVWLAALVLDVTVAITYLPRVDLLSGLVMLAAVAAYLLSHQLVHRNHPWRLPKEICIAGLLVAGVGLFLIRAPRFSDSLTPLTSFGLLCFANCALISVWERHVDRAHGQTSLVANAPTMAPIIHQLPWLIMGVAAVQLAFTHEAARVAAMCTAASALLLGAVDALERRIGRQLARVLADVALMTPAVALWWR